MTLAPGTRLGPYEIVAPIEPGGQADVYRAHDNRLGRDVAIKVPREELARNPAALARFERETRAIASLSHPNILEIHDVGSDAGITYAVTELLLGETLRSRLSRGPLPWQTAVTMAYALAQGLSAAHERGVIHRDLKPGNIFLTEDDRVKILDFGLARLETRHAPPGGATITEPDTILGTVGYMSPEQVRGEKVDARSDIFSLGCVLYEMVTGLHAFSAGSLAETLVVVLREEPADAAQLVPGLPDGVGQILRHCLAKNPNGRFQSARDLAIALEDVDGRSSRRIVPLPRLLPRLALAVGVAIAAGFAYWWWRPIDTVAVLPFAFEAGDPGAEYLGDGVGESLMNSLSRYGGLTVLARTSAFSQKGQVDPIRAGNALGVRAVLAGRVLRRGQGLVIQAELVDVRRRAQLWGNRYERPSGDVQQVEREIDREVAQKLGLHAGQEKEPSKPSTSNAEAYDLYLQGRFHWNKRSPDEVVKAIQLFERAAALDAGFALAQVGLADSYDLLAFYGALPPREAIPKQREAAVRAIEIDDSIAEAHASLAEIRFQYEWDWSGADQGFRRAIALNPSSARAHQWYSNYLSAASRFKPSFEEIRTARRLDPMDLIIRSDEGQAYFFAGDVRRAVDLLRQTVQIDPSLPLPRIYLGLAALARADFTTAIEEAKKAMALVEGYPDPIVLYGNACARAGRMDEARRALQQLDDIARTRYVDGFAVAFLCVGMGEKEKALDALERAYEEHSLRLVYLNVMPAFDPLRAEPRFRTLVERLKIPARPPSI